MIDIPYPALFQALAAQSREGVSLTDGNGRYLMVNAAFCQMTGYSEAELLKMTGHDLIPSVAGGGDYGSSRKGHGGVREAAFRRKDGSVLVAEIQVQALSTADRSLTLSTIRDVSERKQAEMALRESEARFRMLFEHTPLPYYALDAGGFILDVNGKWLETMGYGRAEVIGRSLADFLPPAYHEKFRINLACLLEVGEARAECELIKKNGERLLAAITGKIDWDEEGNFRSTHCIFSDITAQKKNREQIEWHIRQTGVLHQTIERLNHAQSLAEIYKVAVEGIVDVLLADRSSLLLFQEDRVAHFAAWQNLSAEYRQKVDGHCPWRMDEVEAQAIYYADALTADFAPEVREAILSEGIRALLFVPLRGSDHLLGKFMVYFNAPHEWTDLELKLAQVIAQNLAAVIVRLQAMAELQASEARFRLIFRASPDAFCLNRMKDGVCVDVNQGFCDLTGYRGDEVVGRRPLTINFWANRRDFARYVREFRQKGQVTNMEFLLRRKDGRIERGLISARLLELNGGPHLLSIIKSIEELKQVQAKIADLAEFNESIVASAPVGIATINPKGELTSVNDALLEITGSPSRAATMALHAQIDALKDFHLDELLRKILTTGEPFTADRVAYTSHWGKELLVNLKIVPQKTKDGRISGAILVLDDVTAAAYAEENLRQFSRAVESTPLSIVITDKKGKIQYVNPWFTRLTGYTAAEVLGQTPQLWQSGQTPQEVYQGMWQTILSGREWRGELINKNKRGEFYWDMVSISPIIDAEGEITHFVGVQTNITERKQAEARIAELAAFNQNIVASAPVGILTVDRDGNVTSANEILLKMLGSPGLEDTLNLNMDIPALKRVGFDRAFRQVLASGESLILDKLPYMSQWGRELIVNVRIVPQKTKDGRITGVIIVVDDVTGTAEAERLQTAVYRIAQAADRADSLDELYPSIHAIVQTIMPADNFYIALYDKRAGLIHFPYYVDENELLTPELRKPRRGLTEYVLHRGVSHLADAHENQAMIANGEIELIGSVAAVWLGVPLLVEGKAIGVMVVQHYHDPQAYGEREHQILEYVASQVARTIDRKQQEEALRESEEKMRSLARLAQKLEQAHNHDEIVQPLQEEIQFVLGYQSVWIYLVDEDMSQARLLVSAGEIGQRQNDRERVFAVRGDAYLEEFLAVEHIIVIEDARTDPRTNKEMVARFGNRTMINVPMLLKHRRLGAMLTGTFGDEGVKVPTPAELDYLEAVARHVAVVVDRIQFLLEREKSALALQASNQQLHVALTELRETQEKMVQRERLAAVGQLAAGIAHDFNNIMAVIVLYAEMGLRLPGIPAMYQERLQTILRQSLRATDLVQQILDFSRRAVLEPRPMDMVPFLKEQVKMLERTLPESIQMRLEYGLDEYVVNADLTRMQQVVVNLVVNARDAMPNGGELHLGLTRVQEGGELVCMVCQQPIEGDWVCMEVSDNGSGIDAAVLPHIFEPFFTTKEAGKGSGLGLSQVVGIVDQHGGHTIVTSEVGRGTTFLLYLRGLPTVQREEKLGGTAVLPQGSGETILVVEDDVVTRMALAESIELLNYRVVTAVNGQEALAVLAEQAQKIDLVLSDLVMPEMGGQALFQVMQQRQMAVPVVMLSGHPMENDLQKLQADGMAGWLLKPPNMEKLALLLAQVLHRNRRRHRLWSGE